MSAVIAEFMALSKLRISCGHFISNQGYLGFGFDHVCGVMLF